MLDKTAKTCDLVEKSGCMLIQIPTVALVDLTYKVGHRSLFDDPKDLANSGVELFGFDGHDLPFVSGCSAWLACRTLSEPKNEQTYDLFITEIEAAWSDTRVFKDGHWIFETADPALRSLHYIADGHFYAIGEAIDVDVDEGGKGSVLQSDDSPPNASS